MVDRLKHQNNQISHDDVELLDGRIFERYSRPQKLGEKVVGRVWSFRDVTKRRRAEERLRDSEEMLRSILTYSPDAINLIDMDGTIVECNPKALELTGLTSKDDIIGHNMLEAISPDERECMMENIKELIAAGNANRLEYTLVKMNGEPYFAEVTSWAVKDKMGSQPAGLDDQGYHRPEEGGGRAQEEPGEAADRPKASPISDIGSMTCRPRQAVPIRRGLRDTGIYAPVIRSHVGQVHPARPSG